MSMLGKFFAVFVSGALVFGFCACSKGGGGRVDGGGGGGSDVEIPSTTKVLSGSTTQHLSSISPDGVTYTFSQSTSELESLSPDDIIASGVAENAPYGFLRKVTSVSTVGSDVVVQTSDATLEEAIQNGTITISKTFSPADVVSDVPLSAGVTVVPTFPRAEEAAPVEPVSVEYIRQWVLEDEVIYDQDGDLTTTYDQITANGSIAISLSVDFTLKISWFRLKECSFTTTTKVTSELRLNSSVEMLDRTETKELWRMTLTPITVPSFPVVIVPVVTINLGVDGRVSINATAGVRDEATLTAGLAYSNGVWTPMKSFSNDFSYDAPTLSANCFFKAYAGPEVKLLFYGIAGPRCEIHPYLELDADTSRTPWWELYGGLEVGVGLKVDVLGHTLLDYYRPDVIDYRVLLAQATTTPPVFAKTWGGSGYEGVSAIAADPWGSVYCAGYTFSFGAGCSDALLLKYDSSGALQWARTWGGSGDDSMSAVAVDSGGNIYCAGFTSSFGTGEWDALLLKYDSSGTLRWAKTWGSSNRDELRGVAVDSSGNIYCAGTSNGDGLIMKYDSSGALRWAKTWGGSGSDSVGAVVVDSSGNIYCSGRAWGGDWGCGADMALLLKYDSSGTLAWTRVWSKDQGTSASALAVDSSGNIYCAGATSASDWGGWLYDRALLLKYNSSGALQWAKSWGGNRIGLGAVAVDSSGNIYCAGGTNSFGAGGYDALLLQYNSSGALQGAKTWGGSSDDTVCAVAVDSTGNLYLGGSTQSYTGIWQAQTVGTQEVSGFSATPEGWEDSPSGAEGSPEGTRTSPTGSETGAGGADTLLLKGTLTPALTDEEKQQEILAMVNSHRGSIPPELVLAIIRQEGGEGAFYIDESEGAWAQPLNGDGIMQVTVASGYHEKSGPYTHDQGGYDHAIKDGCDYLSAIYNTYGSYVQAVVHYNSGPSTLYIYLGVNQGDRNYLSHVAEHLSNFIPDIYDLHNADLVDALNAGQSILNEYLYNKGIQSGQPVDYYGPYQEQLDTDLHNIEFGG